MKKGETLKFIKDTIKPKYHRASKAVRGFISIVLCTSLILSLSSCWSRRELNTLAIVLATALDVGDKPDTVKVTAQIVKPGGIKAGTSPAGGGAEKAYANIAYTDKSILSALGGFAHITNRRMYFSHNEVLIFSSELAKRGISEGMDTFTRNFETRMNVFVLVSKDKAADLLDEEIELEPMPANHLEELLQNQELSSETAIVTIRDFNIATLSKTMAPVAPMIEMYEFKEKKKARLAGTAVFKEGRMVGQLSVAQTRGLLWVTDKAKRHTITVDTELGKIDLIITGANGSIKPLKNEDGSIGIKLKISAKGCLEGNETEEDMSKLENIKVLSELAEEAIRADIESALKQAQALSADVFGFGEAIRRDYPKAYEKIKDNWEVEFVKLKPELEVEVLLDCTGGIGKPVTPGGGE